MADLGELATVFVADGAGLAIPLLTVNHDEPVARKLPVWLGGAALTADTTGVIAGQVTVQDAPTGGVRVTLHHRKTGVMIDATVSAANGQFQFTGLNRGAADYYAVALTDQPYNALIYDKISAS